jgi:GTP-binding protein HflX
MDQQTGGMARARGPGETASELLARKLDSRLEELQRALRKLTTSAVTQRRQRGRCERIALVGYTNAGKTSLMNALTSAGLSARDMPFETLDTTSRALSRHGGDVLLSDTVGFVRKLPTRLLASFESTLAEVAEASLLAIVVDISDEERELHLDTTSAMIDKIGAGELARFYVFNKLDALDSPPDVEFLSRLAIGHPWALLSTRDATAVAKLQESLLLAVRRDEGALTVSVPYGAAEALSLIHGRCRVLESVAEADGLCVHVRAPRATLSRLKNLLR